MEWINNGCNKKKQKGKIYALNRLTTLGSTVVVGGGVVVPLVYSPVKVQETEMMIIII
jgi:hypothetical protein